MDDKQIHELALFSLLYKDSDRNYFEYKKSIYSHGFDDEKFVFCTIGLILQFYYDSKKNEAQDLYKNLAADLPDNENVIWLTIEVMCLTDLPNDREFISRYMNLKKQKHDFNFQYQIEYHKGLELKQNNYYKEAIAVFENLNKIQPFAWNSYQIAIIKNLLDNESEVYLYLAQAIKLDPAIKDDARTYFGLNNLRDKPEFRQIIE